MKTRSIALAAAFAVCLPAASAGAGPRPQQPVVVNVSQGGFRWGDAAVGAAGATGVALALHGVGLLRRQRKFIEERKES
jgi:hypothetical protein